MAGELSTENCFPVRAEGFAEDVLDGQAELAAGVELAAALHLAEIDPIRSAVKGALEAPRFAERFQEHRALAADPREAGAGSRKADATPVKPGCSPSHRAKRRFSASTAR